jgi:antitoxin component YwqK of YwqJK toxin-antitoxin module
MKKQIIFSLVLNLVSMKSKHLTTAIFFLFFIAASAQDTIYFDKHEAEIQNPKKAKFYRIIQRDSLDKNLASAIENYKSGKIKSKAKLVNQSSVPAKERKTGMTAFVLDKDGKTQWLYHGKYMEWYEKGQLKKYIDFKNGGSSNKLITHWPNGKVKRNEKYDSSFKKLKGECFDENGTALPFTDYFKVPVFDCLKFGTMQIFLSKNFKYPKAFSEKQIMGKMFINSYVNAKGKIVKSSIIRGIEPQFDKEVAALLSKIPIAIGANRLKANPFIGIVDEMALFNRVLSAAEIQGIMNNGISIVTSVKETKAELEMKVYPNPSNGVFQLSTTAANVQYKLVDLVGKELLSGTFSNTFNLNVNQLPKGAYLLNYQADGKQGIQKLMIK